MTFELVHATYSLPEWQAVKLTFFAHWVAISINYEHATYRSDQLERTMLEVTNILHKEWRSSQIGYLNTKYADH